MTPTNMDTIRALRDATRQAKSKVLAIVSSHDKLGETGYPTGYWMSELAHPLEWFFIPLQIPLPIEALFRSDVDLNEPYDRTTIKTPVGVRGEERGTWTTASD